MTDTPAHETGGAVPEIDVTDADLLRDPFTAYGDARERSPLARIKAPGFGAVRALTAPEEARATR
ncbi:hypothetical protein ACI2K4_23515 [Micromonospora sp. NPDC050397]|uniref:hypothetical protein n=1 Tax=Micromonospora sp. NPDC050397 TaxID=3364279 RepID=UPI00384EFD35